MVKSVRKEGIKVFSKKELKEEYSNFPNYDIKDGWIDGTAQKLEFCSNGLAFSLDVIAAQQAKSCIIYELRGPLGEARKAVGVSFEALLKELTKK
ncbi:hypothetical protein LR013_03420 [candidate division NPL-UPA2 bacterium]|nr:hypothetical protein [candidate division NPL-UPA2 bacterium]